MQLYNIIRSEFLNNRSLCTCFLHLIVYFSFRRESRKFQHFFILLFFSRHFLRHNRGELSGPDDFFSLVLLVFVPF